jgi:REP element-mobilizing transposase RayT
MPRRATPLVAGAHYHVFNRGHNREAIFFEPDNYAYFLRQLRKYVVPDHAAVVAYALLPNHYHLLIQTKSSDLSKAMMTLSVSYTKAVNERYGRTGGVFEGAFRAKLIDRDEYLTHLSRYIHLNPVRLGLVSQAEDWPYTSYPEYLGLRRGTLPQPDIVMSQFQDADHYRSFVESYRPDQRQIIAEWLF